MDSDCVARQRNSFNEMDNRNFQVRVCVVTYPFTLSHKTPVYCLLFNFLEIIQSISKYVFIISGNIPIQDIPHDIKNHFINFKMETELRTNYPLFLSLPIWILNYIYGQIKMSFYIIKLVRDVDVVIFFFGYDYILPLCIGKLIGKKTIIVVTMSSDSIKLTYNNFFYRVSRIIESLCYFIVDRLVVDPQNQSLINNQKYSKKIEIGVRYINLHDFKITKKLSERNRIIGFIGRFSKEKGIKNFCDAIPLILKKDPNMKFFIGGDGILSKEIAEKLKKIPSDTIVTSQWIPYSDLPQYLNELSLIVIPSYTETGPFIALEAMACGTPVLATSVGMIPDWITNEKNGFILEDNLPETIAKNVIKAIKNKNLNEIVLNARKMIEKEFTHNIAERRYREIFQRLKSEQRN